MGELLDGNLRFARGSVNEVADDRAGTVSTGRTEAISCHNEANLHRGGRSGGLLTHRHRLVHSHGR